MSNLEKLRNVYYEMLDEVFSIADRHNIPVFLCAGTLLGAIRHKDFIPWDNDVDVVMFRSDFEKLKPFLTAELDPDKYELIEPGFFGNRFLKMANNFRFCTPKKY